MSQSVVTFRQIKPAESCRYDGVSLGEVMLRLDPLDVPTARATLFRVSQGGGETDGRRRLPSSTFFVNYSYCPLDPHNANPAF